MPQFHFEPFLHLVDVTHTRALVAWGGFFCERPDAESRWRIVDDDRLARLDPGRTDSIGTRSEPYGDAVVEAYDESGTVAARSRTRDANHAWLDGLEPGIRYSYRVAVDGGPAITPVAAVGPDGDLEVMTALSPGGAVVPPPFVVTAL